MKTLTVLTALVLSVAIVSAEETVGDLKNALAQKQDLLFAAQTRLKNAETSFKSNSEAVGRTKSADDQKLLRTYIATAQANVAKERTEVFTIQRDVDPINQRIAVIQKAAEAPASLQPELAVAQADAPKPAAQPQPLKTALLKDGTKIQYVRCMELDGDYALQLADKKIKNVKKDDVRDIESTQ